ncbi:MAG: GNAT family N-acetyltransferase [Candidatus Omnitrophica bacterium]|nr:GNAT family N-acetyltransferase [Candidatus Omnitrophota bacterium]
MISAADVTPVYVASMNDPEVVGLTEARHVVWDHQRVAQFIERSNVEGVSTLVGIFLKDTGRHIGNLRLFNFHPVHRRAELSFVIFDKTQWSKGYATEAVGALCRYAFETMRLHRIHADYYATNHASARLFQKAGFQVEGVYRGHFFADGRYVDSIRVATLNPTEQRI